MKATRENMQEPQKEKVQHIEKKSSTGGEAMISDNRPAIAVQRKIRSVMGGTKDTNNPIQRKRNNTGLPNKLKAGIENLSGYGMDDVKVHYNSSKPAQLQAHAYAQGTDIHLGPGQEKHLPHEAWHVVQQKQGRVKPTLQFKGKVGINDDAGLEKEANVMGQRATQLSSDSFIGKAHSESGAKLNIPIIQREVDRSDFERYNNLSGALKNYEDLEQPGLEKKSFLNISRYTGSKYDQNSALISRFSRAQNTTLKFQVQRDGNCDLARTRLYGMPENGGRFDLLEYDDNHSRFMEHISNRSMESFLVTVTIVPFAAQSYSEGFILQSLTHELTVHAKFMMDFIDAYFVYKNKTGGRFNKRLKSAKEEHASFYNKKTKFELIKQRLENDQSIDQQIKDDFNQRDKNDRNKVLADLIIPGTGFTYNTNKDQFE